MDQVDQEFGKPNPNAPVNVIKPFFSHKQGAYSRSCNSPVLYWVFDFFTYTLYKSGEHLH